MKFWTGAIISSLGFVLAITLLISLFAVLTGYNICRQGTIEVDGACFDNTNRTFENTKHKNVTFIDAMNNVSPLSIMIFLFFMFVSCLAPKRKEW